MPKIEPHTLNSLTPPQSLDAEMGVLGSLLLDSEAFEEVSSLLTPEDFYRESNGKIYAAMQRLRAGGEPLDLLVVADALGDKIDEVGGLTYLISLAENTPSAANAAHYARIVQQKSILRQIIQRCTAIMKSAYEESSDPHQIIERGSQALFEIARGSQDATASMNEMLPDSLEYIRRLYETKGQVVGLPTGFRDLDRIIGGLEAGSLSIVAARPSMGKSALGMQIATHAALKQGVPALIFSLEMPHRQLVTRMICGEARIDMARLRQGHLGERDFERLEAATQRIGQAPIFINDQGSIDMSGIRSVARRYRQREGIGLIVVDYLQLIECEDQENRVQQISAISRGLKLLARELDLPIIALSQLSRAVESRPNKRPMLSDLRESGAIEQDADLVMFIYRDDYYNPHSEKAGIAEIIVAKQRNGPVGTAELQFHAAHVRFNDLTLDHLQ